ncbi:hypothetical protein BJX96DRAFT_157258 [Aspergillus floccosus]
MGQQDFNNALKLYGESTIVARPHLSIYFLSDQDKLYLVSQILDKLNQTTPVLQHNPSSHMRRAQ